MSTSCVVGVQTFGFQEVLETRNSRYLAEEVKSQATIEA